MPRLSGTSEWTIEVLPLPIDCTDPVGTHGDIVCGDGSVNQPVTTNKYGCNDGVWDDLGDSCVTEDPCPGCLVADICTWIESLGGPSGVTTAEVLHIVDVRLGIASEPFSVTTSQVLGIIDYRLGYIESGNNNTGCEFV